VEAAPSPASDAAAAPIPIADAGLAPLTGVPWQIDVEDSGKKLGAISIPLGAREPRPIVVALHGAADKPGWACGEWRAIVDAYPFVVCPRGDGPEEHLYWSSPAKTKEAIDRLLDATRARFGAWIAADAPLVLVGFSMGSGQAMLLAEKDPKRFPRVVAAENAYDPDATQTFAATYKGERAGLLCTTFACGPVYRAAGARLARRGIPARVNISGTNAHGMWESTNRSMRRDWPWVVDGLAGWEEYGAQRLPADASPPGTTLVFEPSSG
jgi:pimeloyl-ACP methyl ester carboxylesterase